MLNKQSLIEYFNNLAPKRDTWKAKNWYYHRELEKLCSFIIPTDCTVLELGCGTGDLLNAVKPRWGIGLDWSIEMVKIAKSKYPHLNFVVCDAENLCLKETFEYVILSDLIGDLRDVWSSFRELKKVTDEHTKIIVTYYNYLWEPILKLGEAFLLKTQQKIQNWLPLEDIQNMLYLSGFESIKKGYRLLFPKYIPLISMLLNRYIAKLPLIKRLCLIGFVVAKKTFEETHLKDNYTCSIVIPCRDEVGNIEGIISRTPEMGRDMEFIFVDGKSTDGTVEKIYEMMQKYPKKNIKLIFQGEPKGKGDAVRKGFEKANGDILFILDADLTVAPEDLPRFYTVLAEGKGEFISGSRLVYPMEKQAMRILNVLGNKFFSIAFSWLLEQRIRDTLCGTKVIFKKDYLRIKEGRKFFGDFDPFGDFDLLFGAAKLNLKIVEMPVRYHERTYGVTKISRFKHGFLLLEMCLVAMRKLKFT